MAFTDILGYTASVLVALSMMMRQISHLRLLNLAGAVCFLCYGVLIRSHPIILLNVFIIAVNLYYLITYYRKPPQS